MTGTGVWGACCRFLLTLCVPCTLFCVRIPESLAHPQPCQILKRIGHTVRVGALHLQPRVLNHESLRIEKLTGEWTTNVEREWVRVNRSVSGPGGPGGPGFGSLRTRGSVSNQNKGARGKNMLKQAESEVSVFMPRDSVLLAMETLNRVPGLLPYNLSLEVVMAVEAGLGELPAFSFSSSFSSSPLCDDPVSFLESVCHTVVVQGVSAMLAFPQTRDELVELDFVSSALQIPVISVVESEFRRQSKVSGPVTGLKTNTD